jgi:uncharacterized protein CbrC (UPF0167 family)
MVVSPIPRMHLHPRVMEWPDPGCQQSQWVIHCLDLVKFLQKIEAALVVTVSDRSQLVTVCCERYLYLIIECQMPGVVNTYQRELVASAWIK